MPGVIKAPNTSEEAAGVSPFPADALPPVLRKMAEAISEVTRTPLDLSGPCILATASACLGRGMLMRSAPGRLTAPNLYLLLIKPSGAGGSTAYAHATAPLRGFQADALRQYDAEEKPRLERRRATLQSDIQRLVKARSKAREDNDAARSRDLEKELEGLHVELSAVERLLVPPFYHVGDVTPERMAGIMEGRGGVLAHFDPDGSDTIAGLLGIRYGKGDHASDTLHLKSYTGESLSISRQGSGGNSSNVFLENPCLACLFVVTPDVAKKLTGSERMREGGLLPRFLISMSRARPVPWDEEAKEIPSDVADDYERAAFAMLNNFRNLALGELPPVEMEAEARAVFAEHWAGYCERYNPASAAFEARHTENAMRMALVLHAWGNIILSEPVEVMGHERPVTAQTARDALRLLEWFTQHQNALLAPQREAEREKLRERVMGLFKPGREKIKRGDVVGARIHADALAAEQLLEAMVTEGLLVKEEPERPSSGGRPPVANYRRAGKPLG